MRHFKSTLVAAAHSMQGWRVIARTVLGLRRCLAEKGFRGDCRGNGHGRSVHEVAASDATIHAQFFISPTHRLVTSRVISHCDRKMVITENKKIRVAMAFISGVAPRRSRDQISSGSVFSLPIRKKVTAISSIDSVKISSAVPRSEVR